MDNIFSKILDGYQSFREKYVFGDKAVMDSLANQGQKPHIMFVACCDSRVDPALILQCDPGDLFVVRNVANIVPPFERDLGHHGTSAALEFGICNLNIKHLILLGHSQCGGMQALLDKKVLKQNDFISSWVTLVEKEGADFNNAEDYAKFGLEQSYLNCLTFPWIKEKVLSEELTIHQWFFDIKTGQIHTFSKIDNGYKPLEPNDLIATI